MRSPPWCEQPQDDHELQQADRTERAADEERAVDAHDESDHSHHRHEGQQQVGTNRQATIGEGSQYHGKRQGTLSDRLTERPRNG